VTGVASPLDAATVTRAAQAAAAALAERAGVEVRTLSGTDELARAAQLFTELWASPFSDQILRALDISGNYVAGAFDVAGTLVAASAGFAAISDEPEIHSHVTGVALSHRRSGLGLVLKFHQRSWALERGIGLITWTFDPLIKRNANFNLARLGATADEYRENVYGDMDDALNSRDESDRLWVSWRLAEPEVEAAAAGQSRHVPTPAGDLERLKPSPDGTPLTLTASEPAGQAFTCQVPDDIESLRRKDPETASAWRLALRDVLGEALASGGRILGVNTDGNYVVVPEVGGP
jgi:predicted GNAT superfamily acetyltransferase